MKDELAQAVVPQIKDLIGRFEKLQARKKYDDYSDIDVDAASDFVTGGMAAIYRAVGRESPYSMQVEESMEKLPAPFFQARIPYVGGSLKALLRDIESGYLLSLQQRIHAEVFADFLEMANHLLQDGYKDPAAVLIGSALEGHLRKLCEKNTIPTEFVDSSGKLRAKKVETMNAELAKAGVYLKTDQKSVTAWYGLRTDAAHGHYDRYSEEQVRLMLDGVRNFLARHPA